MNRANGNNCFLGFRYSRGGGYQHRSWDFANWTLSLQSALKSVINFTIGVNNLGIVVMQNCFQFHDSEKGLNKQEIL